jgi:hypothetical protein
MPDLSDGPPPGSSRNTTTPHRRRTRRPHLPGGPDPTFVITAALPSATSDRHTRMRRYLLSQLFRLVCFLAAVIAPLPILGRMILIAASIVLPWGAVVAANAGPALTNPRMHRLFKPRKPPATSTVTGRAVLLPTAQLPIGDRNNDAQPPPAVAVEGAADAATTVRRCTKRPDLNR